MIRKVLLLLNGPQGWQTGTEDGFLSLHREGKISEPVFFYFQAHAAQSTADETRSQIMALAVKHQPDAIVFFHISKFHVPADFIGDLRNISSSPLIVYDEGDMYGTWAKPILPTMKEIMRSSDAVSIRGRGRFLNDVMKYNKNVFYTPHHADIARFDKEPYILSERKNKLVLIGNKVKPRFLSFIRRMPGAKEREEFVRFVGDSFPEDFVLYGNGWEGFRGNRGPLDFQKQMDVYRDSWITVAYEHYPDVADYFSNRLPIALLSGSLYICHYHEGYEKLFRGCEFIFFFRSNQEALDKINMVLSLPDEEKLRRSRLAREFALRYYHPDVIWKNFYEQMNMYFRKKRND
jgi:hypothetical protein